MLSCTHPNCYCETPCSAWHSRIPFRPGHPPSKSSTATPFGRRASPIASPDLTPLNSTVDAIMNGPLPAPLRNDLYYLCKDLQSFPLPASALPILRAHLAAIMDALVPLPTSTESPGQTSPSPPDWPSDMPAETEDVPDERTGVLCPKCRGTGNIHMTNLRDRNTGASFTDVALCNRCNATGFIA